MCLISHRKKMIKPVVNTSLKKFKMLNFLDRGFIWLEEAIQTERCTFFPPLPEHKAKAIDQRITQKFPPLSEPPRSSEQPVAS